MHVQPSQVNAPNKTKNIAAKSAAQVREARGESKYSVATELAVGESDEKYWRPRISSAAWDIINYRKHQEFDDPAFDIDETEKWLYANTKGIKVFAVYSKNDPDDPTVEYAAQGRTAEKKYVKLMKYMEGKKNAVTQSGSDQAGADAHRWAATVPPEGGTAAADLPDDGHRRADAENVPVHGKESGRNGRAADDQSRAADGRPAVTEQPNQASEESGAFISPEAAQAKFSIVTDPEVIERLGNDDYLTVCKAMQVIDGELYPPMAAEVKDGNPGAMKNFRKTNKKVRFRNKPPGETMFFVSNEEMLFSTAKCVILFYYRK